MRNFIVPALLAATLAMPAMAQPLQHFTRDGEAYSYAADRQADGSILLRGTVDSTGDAFVLRIRGDHVAGSLGMSRVSFQIPRETASKLSDEVAATPTTLAAN